MFSFLRPFVFNLDPETAHDLAIKSLKYNFLPSSLFSVTDEEMLHTKLFGKEIGKDFYEGKTTLPIIIIFQRASKTERDFLKDIFRLEKRSEKNFNEVLNLINKYKAVEESLKRAEYFVNVSRDALGIFNNSKEKEILQSLSNFSLNRNY